MDEEFHKRHFEAHRKIQLEKISFAIERGADATKMFIDGSITFEEACRLKNFVPDNETKLIEWIDLVIASAKSKKGKSVSRAFVFELEDGKFVSRGSTKSVDKFIAVNRNKKIVMFGESKSSLREIITLDRKAYRDRQKRKLDINFDNSEWGIFETKEISHYAYNNIRWNYLSSGFMDETIRPYRPYRGK
jgi:hypothetical protein